MSFIWPSVFFADNKWFDTPRSCYLINLATLVFAIFGRPKHLTFAQCLIWNVLEPPDLNLKWLKLDQNKVKLTEEQVLFYPLTGSVIY